jgi:hypothetical protein
MYLDTELAHGFSPAFRGYEATTCAVSGVRVSFGRFESGEPRGRMGV